jgi:hypothetical protein
MEAMIGWIGIRPMDVLILTKAARAHPDADDPAVHEGKQLRRHLAGEVAGSGWKLDDDVVNGPRSSSDTSFIGRSTVVEVQHAPRPSSGAGTSAQA